MSTESLVLMLLSMVVIWGGLAAAVTMLVRRPFSTHMPPGGEDDPVADD